MTLTPWSSRVFINRVLIIWRLRGIDGIAPSQELVHPRRVVLSVCPIDEGVVPVKSTIRTLVTPTDYPGWNIPESWGRRGLPLNLAP